MPDQRIVSVIGLGYVGLTTAVAFSQVGKVIAYDINPRRINELKAHHDYNDEVSDEALTSPNLDFTTNIDDLKKANFHIITVPTPLDTTKHPNFTMLLNTTEALAHQLKPGDIVVFESTVYPGATEEKCIPLLEAISHLTCGKDFSVGYSPERVNPGDRQHVFANIIKIVSGYDEKTLDIIAKTYGQVVPAGIFRASSIRVAEACKVVENTQRDVNIALMNDLAIMLHKLNIDTAEVIAAIKTKWNALPFQPGLVGGHCIGVNSYYLLHKAQEAGYYSEIISASRRMNESITKFIVDEAIRILADLNKLIKGSRIAVLGLTYKENCPDLRDSMVIEIIQALKAYDMTVFVCDPIADPAQAKSEYGITLTDWKELKQLDAIILTVAHTAYVNLNKDDYLKKFNSTGLIMDIKEVLKPQDFEGSPVTLWRL